MACSRPRATSATARPSVNSRYLTLMCSRRRLTFAYPTDTFTLSSREISYLQSIPEGFRLTVPRVLRRTFRCGCLFLLVHLGGPPASQFDACLYGHLPCVISVTSPESRNSTGLNFISGSPFDVERLALDPQETPSADAGQSVSRIPLQTVSPFRWLALQGHRSTCYHLSGRPHVLVIRLCSIPIQASGSHFCAFVYRLAERRVFPQRVGWGWLDPQNQGSEAAPRGDDRFPSQSCQEKGCVVQPSAGFLERARSRGRSRCRPLAIAYVSTR